jgi:hypothetical protein
MRLISALLASLCLLCGCGNSSTRPPAGDLGHPADLAAPHADLAVADLAAADDGAVPDDQAPPFDASDGAVADLARPPDLLSKADAGLCANVVCGAKEACCPCTGLCYSTACLACCMFCN